jgi:hypothetical protein
MEVRKPSPSTDFSTPSLDRALAVLECLAARSEGLTQTELASDLGLTANFVYRTTQSLAGPRLPPSRRRQAVPPQLGSCCGSASPCIDDIPSRRGGPAGDAVAERRDGRGVAPRDPRWKRRACPRTGHRDGTDQVLCRAGDPLSHPHERSRQGDAWLSCRKRSGTRWSRE